MEGRHSATVQSHIPSTLVHAVLALVCAPLPARANGAFPDSGRLVAPEGTRRLILSTTFGLVLSDDDGAAWSWVCEEAIGPPNVSQYVPAAPPSTLVWAVDGLYQLSVSPDGGRTWGRVADRMVAAGEVTDVFTDPLDPLRALVAMRVKSPSNWQVVETLDGGASFHVLYEAPSGQRVISLESARTDPKVIAVILLDGRGADVAPVLVRTTDGGVHWTTFPLAPFTGLKGVRIAAIDRARADVLYLRVFSAQPGTDALAVVKGDEVTLPLTTNGAMSTFLQREDGTLFVASQTGGAWRSTDAGGSFAPWTGQPHLRALASRGARLYAAADAFADGYAVATSDDDGASWKPLLVWPALCGVYPSATLEVTCREPWRQLVDTFGIGEPGPSCPSPVTIDEPVEPVTPDAVPTGGCDCRTGPLGMAGLLVVLRRRRQR